MNIEALQIVIIHNVYLVLVFLFISFIHVSCSFPMNTSDIVILIKLW